MFPLKMQAKKIKDLLKKPNFIFIAFLSLAAITSRFFWIGKESFWLDEVFAIYNSPDLLKNLIQDFQWTYAHPPLSEASLVLWQQLFGTSEVALRSLSALFGVATILLTYYVGKKLISTRVGILASILVLANPVHLYYSQEARPYAMIMFFALLSSYFLYQLLKRGTIIYAGLYTLTTVILGYSDYPSILIILAQATFSVIWFLNQGNRKWETVKKVCFSYIAFIFLYSPLLISLYYAIKQGLRPTGNFYYVSSPSLPEAWNTFLSTIGVVGHSNPFLLLFNYGDNFASILGSIVALIWILMVIRSLRQSTHFISLASIVTFLPIVIFIESKLLIPIFYGKGMSIYVPYFALVIAAGLNIFWTKKIGAPLWSSLFKVIIVLFTIFLIFINVSYMYAHYTGDTKANWRKLAKDLEKLPFKYPILIHKSYFIKPFKYYYQGSSEIIPISGRDTDLEKVKSISNNCPKFSLISRDPDKEIFNQILELTSSNSSSTTIRYHGPNLYMYDRKSEYPSGAMKFRSYIPGVNIPGSRDHLVALWKMDKGSGNRITDTAKQNDGNLKGPIWKQINCRNKYIKNNDFFTLQFDGVDDYIKVSHDNSLNLKGELTIAAWIKLREVGTGKQILVQKRVINQPDRFTNYSFYTQWSTDRLAFVVGDGDRRVGLLSDKGLGTANRWHFVAVTFNKVSHEVRFYIDGELAGVDKVTIKPYTNEGPLNVGRYTSKTGQAKFHFKGEIDEIAIYRKALSDFEIKELFSLLGKGIGLEQQKIEQTNAPVIVRNLFGVRKIDLQTVSKNSPKVSLHQDLGIAVSQTAELTLTMFKFSPGEYIVDLDLVNKGQLDENCQTTLSISLMDKIFDRTRTIDKLLIQKKGLLRYSTKKIGIEHPKLLSLNIASTPNCTSVNKGQKVNLSDLWLQNITVRKTTGNGKFSSFSFYTPWKDGRLALIVKNTNRRIGVLSDKEVRSPTKWHHVALTFGMNYKAKFYIDGKIAGVDTIFLRPNIEMKRLILGTDLENEKPKFSFNGAINDVRIYNKALAGPKIQEIFQKGQDVEQPKEASDRNLVKYWNFSEGEVQTSSAKLGDENVIVHDGSWEVAQPNGGLKFDGVDDYIEITDRDGSLMIIDEFTISAWVKLDEPSKRQVLIQTTGAQNKESERKP